MRGALPSLPLYGFVELCLQVKFYIFMLSNVDQLHSLNYYKTTLLKLTLKEQDFEDVD
jgi:hypothetical protein